MKAILSKKQLLLLLTLLLTLSHYIQAQTRYFKCTIAASPGVYQWSNAANWYTDAACTIPAGAIPISSSDVMFSAVSFTANNQSVSFNQTTMACRNFSVTNSAFTGCGFQGVTSTKLSVFGDFTMAALTNTASLSISNWGLTTLEFNPVNIGVQSVTTGTANVFSNFIEIPGNTLSRTVNFMDTLQLSGVSSNALSIGVGYTNATSVNVNFNQLIKLKQAAGGIKPVIHCISGTTNMNNGIVFSSAFPTSLPALVATPNQAFAGAGGLKITNSAIVNVSPNSQRGRNEVHQLTIQGNSSAPAQLNATNQTIISTGGIYIEYGTVDFTNDQIDIHNFLDNGNLANSGLNIRNGTSTALNMTGSTLNLFNITPTNMRFIPNDKTFHIVNIYGNTIVSAVANNGDLQVPSQTSVYDRLSILNGASLSNNALVTYSINPSGTFSMTPGTDLTGSFPYTNHIIKTSLTSSVSMVGNCNGIIGLSNAAFNFTNTPIANITIANLNLNNCQATGLFANYNPGPGSLTVYGTNCSGWQLNCSPVQRTLYWQGALANGLWSNPDSWSINPLASPTLTQTPISSTGGFCYPTYQDSIVIPIGSVVNVDPVTAYAKSIRFMGVATLTTTNLYNPSLEVWGTWWANKYLNNSYKGLTKFKTYESYPLIKTGGVPFTSILFNGQDVPNASCVVDLTKPRGKWLLLDTLVMDDPARNGWNFTSGRLHTYSSAPAFATYFPTGQHKGSTIISRAYVNGFNVTFANSRDTVSLYDSDIYIFHPDAGGSNPLFISCPNDQLLEGTSNFIFCNTSGSPFGAPASLIGNPPAKGQKLHEVTVDTYSAVPNVSANQFGLLHLPQSVLSSSCTVNFRFQDYDTIMVVNNHQNLLFWPNGISKDASYIQKITNFNDNGFSYLTFINNGLSPAPTYTPLTIDSLITYGNLNILNSTNTSSITVRINKGLSLERGNIVFRLGNSTGTSSNNNAVCELANGSTFLSKGTCGLKNLVTSYTPLGTATALSSFKLLGVCNHTISNTDIQDNIVTGGTLNTSGLTSGTASGWVPGSAPAPRLLHWTDGITAGGITKDWSSTDRWRQAIAGSTSPSGIGNLVWGTTPQCPPTCADTVYIDNSSFTSTLTVGDHVQINGLNYQAAVGKLYWNTTAALTYSPSMTGVASSQLSVCDSLYFCDQMVNNYIGTIVLKGNSLPGSSYHGIKSANKQFPGRLIIDCSKAALTEYRMRDSLTATYAANVASDVNQASLNHLSGNLNTNGFALNLYSYSSVSNLNRKLTITGSRVMVNGYHFRRDEGGYNPYFGPTGWLVINNGSTKTYSLQAASSRIVMNTDPANLSGYGNATGNGIIGGGYKYNDIEFYGNSAYPFNSGGQIGGTYKAVHFPAATLPASARIDTFNQVINNINTRSATLSRLYIGRGVPFDGIGNYPCLPYVKVHAVVCNNSPLDITGIAVDVDSMEFYYRHPTLASYNIYSSNRYFQHWGLYGISAPQQVNMAKDSVQWLQNTCDFRPAGNNTNKVNFFSLTPGSKTYIRKDSGRVCADWLVLKDIWAVGSGSTKGPVTTPLCLEPSATDFRCDWDTLSTFDGGGYGPVTATSPTDPNYTTSGRAWFQGGNGTDFQANNQGWEKKDTEPEPKLALSQNSTICEGDTAIITFNVQGVFPFNIYFNSNTSSPSFPVSANTMNNINFTIPTSYTQLPAVATYSASTNPVGYMYYLVPQNGTALNAGTASNPYVLSVKVTPTVTTQYNLGYLVTGKCVNNISTAANATGNALVNVNPAPLNMLTSVTPSVICTGAPVTYTANAIYGSAYFLYTASTGSAIAGSLINSTTGTVTTGSLTVTTYTNSGVLPLNYSVYMGAVSSNGCSSLNRTPLIVTVNPLPQIASSTQTNVACFGGSTGSINITVTGGMPAYTYSWSSGVTSVTNTAMGLPTGNYTITVTDARSCVNTQTFSIAQPTSSISVSSSSVVNVACFGNATGSYQLMAAGGTPSYTYSWSPGVSSTTNTATGLTQGNYTVSVKDLNNCVLTNTFSISQPAAALSIASAVTGTVGCFSASTGSLQITPTGGTPSYSYSWAPVSASTNTISGLAAGNYTATVTDINNCKLVQQFSVAQPTSAISISSVVSSSLTCFGNSTGSASVTVSGGTPAYTYSWSPGIASVTDVASSLSAGNYTVTGTDANNCVVKQAFVISEPALLTAAITNTTQANCGLANASASVVAVGGMGAYVYSWVTSAASYSTTSAVTNSLAAGINNLTITDVNGCMAQVAVTITNPNAPVITTTVTNVLCFNASTGSIVSAISGGSAYTYTWSNGAHTASLVNAIAGIYTLTVADNNNCLSVVTATVTQPVNALSLAFTNITGVNCFGQNTGSANGNATGGTPGYTYLWMPGNSILPALANAAAGTYTLSVTDNNGCVLNNTVSITGVGSGVDVALTNSVNPVCGKTDGQLAVNASGGTPVYTYIWNTGEHTSALNGIPGGNYMVIVSDSYGCMDSLSFTLECKFDLLIPQIFSPNGDGKNDKFEIMAIKNYPDNTLSVFNRWGSLIYKKQKYANDWDGKANVNDALGNGLLPSGTYYVVLEFNDGITPTYTGYVELKY